MKDLLLSCLFLFTAVFSYSQAVNNTRPPQLPLTANKIVYKEIVSLAPSMSREKLFGNAQRWYKHNFESADNTLTINNSADGEISGTGIIHARNHEKETDPGDLFFTINIIVVKGLYQYKVDSIYGFEKAVKFYYSDMYNEELYPPARPRWPQPYRRMMLNNMNSSVLEMIAKLKEDMKAS